MNNARVQANGLRFAYVEEGEGPLVLLLHGFPDNALTWDRVMPALAEAGYRAVAPFLRGYPPSEIPADGGYGPAVLGEDAAAMIEALGGGEPAFVIGHDWGAIATHSLLARRPELVRRAVISAGAHPANVLSIFERPKLLHAAFHVWLFQLPGVAEQALRANDLALVDYLWQLWSPGIGDEGHRKRVKETLAEPGAVEAALAYYRALVRAPQEDPAFTERTFRPATVPVLAIHGANDVLGALAEGEERHFAAGYRHEVVEGAGHFVHREQPERVAQLALEWFGEE